MTIFDEVCSRCGLDGVSCICENFHPNIPRIAGRIKPEPPPTPKLFIYPKVEKLIKGLPRRPDQLAIITNIQGPGDELCLSREEAHALIKFLDKAGYISYEYHPIIHSIYARIDKYLTETEK